jgi:periplasmic divalent cation tolerance protein
MVPMKPIAVFTTVGSEDEAKRIAQALVERKLAACVQISAIESYYHWKDAVQNEREFRLLIKTVDERYTAVEAAIREMHSYELPAIHACAIDRIFAPYSEWITENSSPAPISR